MKKIKLLSLFLAVSMTVVGCTSGTTNQEENTESNTGETKDVTVVLDWTPNTNHTGLYVALDKGYYEEAGLNVEIIQPSEGTAPQLVAANKAQFGISFQDEMAFALSSEEALPITAVAGIIQHNSSGIISRADKGIVSPKDMEGKTYASWDSPFEIGVLTSVMEKDGGDFSKVNSVPNTVTDVVTALNTDIDTVWIYYNWDGVATELAGMETNYFAFKDLDPALDYYTPVLITNNTLIEEDPELVDAFVDATQKGYEYAIENPDEAADILIKNAPESNADLVKASQNLLASEYKAEQSQWGVFDEDRWNNFYVWMFENNIIDKDISGSGFTNEFIEN